MAENSAGVCRKKVFARYRKILFQAHFSSYYTTIYQVKLLKECENFMPRLQIRGYIEFIVDFGAFFGGKTLDI